jgi:hypothetical protein
MKIKKNTFSTLVLELFFPSIANCRKLILQNRLPLLTSHYIDSFLGKSKVVGRGDGENPPIFFFF